MSASDARRRRRMHARELRRRGFPEDRLPGALTVLEAMDSTPADPMAGVFAESKRRAGTDVLTMGVAANVGMTYYGARVLETRWGPREADFAVRTADGWHEVGEDGAGLASNRP